MFSFLFSVLWSQWTLLLGVIIFVTYKWLVSPYDFFIKKNVKFEKPIPLFGNCLKLVLQREHSFDMVKRTSLKFKNHKYYGVFVMRIPLLMVHDPEIIKQITIKDFDSFLNRRMLIDPKSEPLLGHSLFFMQDRNWKDMRATLSPAFTGSKMRLMFQFIEECSQNASQYLRMEMKGEESFELNLKDFFRRFTNDVIASCAFGMRVNSLSEKDNQFYNLSKKAVTISGLTAVRMFVAAHFQKLAKLLKLRIFDEKFANYFTSLVLHTMKERDVKGIIRPDMIQLLMEAQKGTLQASDLGQVDTVDGFATAQESEVGLRKISRTWTDEYLVAQCFLFFVAGFENSAALMCLCAHELMENPVAQEQLIKEIDKVREELGGKPLTYEVLRKMKYMDMVMSETLRKYPITGIIDRVCNKPYIIGDKDGEHVKIDKGDFVGIPIAGLHYNPKYYPEPTKFDPERFSDENKYKIQPFTYFPFGLGPRNCIASRFALMESKAIIFHLLSTFTFEASPKSCVPFALNKSSFQFQPKGGFWLNFVTRK